MLGLDFTHELLCAQAEKPRAMRAIQNSKGSFAPVRSPGHLLALSSPRQDLRSTCLMTCERPVLGKRIRGKEFQGLSHALPLSASLVVYEHRSRLERSLQKERGEHKKTKEGESLGRPALQLSSGEMSGLYPKHFLPSGPCLGVTECSRVRLIPGLYLGNG